MGLAGAAGDAGRAADLGLAAVVDEVRRAADRKEDLLRPAGGGSGKHAESIYSKPKAAARDRWQQQAAADSEAWRSDGGLRFRGIIILEDHAPGVTSLRKLIF